MGHRGLRVLVLACCLPLALPPGWCCYLLLKIEPKATATTTAGKTAPLKSSGLCGCHTHDPQPQNDERNPQEPPAPPFQHCPCSDRQTTPPSFSSVQPDDGSVFVSILPFTDSSPPASGGGEKVVPVARPPACPLHVRNCVWRC